MRNGRDSGPCPLHPIRCNKTMPFARKLPWELFRARDNKGRNEVIFLERGYDFNALEKGRGRYQLPKGWHFEIRRRGSCGVRYAYSEALEPETIVQHVTVPVTKVKSRVKLAIYSAVSGLFLRVFKVPMMLGTMAKEAWRERQERKWKKR